MKPSLMRTRLRGRMARWIRKRQGPDSLPLTLARRRLYILPTRAGAGFGLLLVVMLVAGLDVRILGLDGSPLRQLTLDPKVDYQRQP